MDIDWQTFAHDADVGVRGCGDTPAEAFAGAGLALTATVCDPDTVRAQDAVDIECALPATAGTLGTAGLELLLVDWLNALVFEMATRRMLFSRFEVSLHENGLRARAWGEPVDIDRHQPAAEPKGASFCELKVERDRNGRWLAQCVVDV